MSMGSDKDEALRSLEIAKRAESKGDREKARKFALKARKIYDCDEVTQFLEQLRTGNVPGPSSKASPSHGPSVRQRPNRSPNQGTEEQRILIAKIKRAKDFYETLDLTTDANDDDIKKAYRKLALKLHPDKNKAAGAEEAFKAVSRAFSCLSDSEKRQIYDKYGSEEPARLAQHQGHYRNGQQFYTDEVDPEMLFQMFFGGGFPMNGHRIYTSQFGRRNSFRRQQQSADEQTPVRGNISTLFSLLPLVAFLVITYLSGTPDQVYSLTRAYPFENEMITERYGVPFYVKSRTRFNHAFPSGTHNRQQLEIDIEQSAERVLGMRCKEERERKRRIRVWKGEEAANKVDLRSCLELRNRFQDPRRRRLTSH